MKNAQALLDSAHNSKIALNEKIDAYITKIISLSKDPDASISLDMLEKEWHDLRLFTERTLSDIISESLTALDTKERAESIKKAIPSRKE